jgi:predicted metalloprotease with PDZ domain
MKKTFLVVLIFAALSSFAADSKKTVVIRGGKIISGETPDLTSLFGKHAFLGVVLNDLSPELREYFGAPRENGSIVASVEADSPADKAGLKVGDIITSVDGKDIDSAWGLRRALRDKKDGEAARIEVIRGKTRQTLVATVVEREPRFMKGDDFAGLSNMLTEQFNSPEWKARIDRMPDCGALQSRIRDLEARMKDLEKKLEK